MSEAPYTIPWPATLPVLEGARVRLRPERPEDAEALFAVFSDPVVKRYGSSPAWTALDEAHARIAAHARYFAQREAFAWGVALRESDVLIGDCSLFDFSAQNRRCEIGYGIGSAHFGKGLASEAVALAIGYAFETLGLQRIEADIDPRNVRSEKLLLRCGFKHEGLLRERWIVSGEVSDSALLGLLRREWTGPPPVRA